MAYCLNGEAYSSARDSEERPGDDRDPSVNNRNNNLWKRWRRWIKCKKGCLFRDSNTTGEEDMVRGKICWKQPFRKIRAGLKKMIATDPSQGFKYDGVSYALNFDDGRSQQLDEHCFGCKYCARAVYPAVFETFKPGA